MIGRSVFVSFSLSLPNISISLHKSWFMIRKTFMIKERNGMKIHVKLQFINGSNFVKIAKRRTKMTHVIPKWFDVSLF